MSGEFVDPVFLEFDGTREESARWQASAGGEAAMAELPPAVRQRLFGEAS